MKDGEIGKSGRKTKTTTLSPLFSMKERKKAIGQSALFSTLSFALLLCDCASLSLAFIDHPSKVQGAIDQRWHMDNPSKETKRAIAPSFMLRRTQKKTSLQSGQNKEERCRDHGMTRVTRKLYCFPDGVF